MNMSKNAFTIEQLKLACSHVMELIDAGVSENLAIKSLETYANDYAKHLLLGRIPPENADLYDNWSEAARIAKAENPEKPYREYLRIEHGTPKRQFARLVLDGFKEKKLTKPWMDRLCHDRWKVAVITLAEDERLSELGGRSTLLDAPDTRWAAAKIKF